LPESAALLGVFYSAIESQLLPRMRELGIELPLSVRTTG
jgi:hypothetical protein